MTTSQSRRRFLRSSATLSLLGLAGGAFTTRSRAASPASPLSPLNERIQKAREVALSVLKPSQRDLDYGFKLHADQSLAWTNWPLFTVGLVQRGHSDATIRKILGENVLRIARANCNSV